MRALLLVLVCSLASVAQAGRAPRTRPAPPPPPPPVVVAAPVPPSPPPPPPLDPLRPHVESVSNRRAFVNRGAKDGLVAGAILTLERAGAKVACTVDLVSAHHASCVGAGVDVGDTFTLAQVPTSKEKPAKQRSVAPLAGLQPELLRTSTQALVPFKSSEADVARSRAFMVSLDHLQWGAADGLQTLERVDVAIAGLPLGAGFSLDARVAALAWTSGSNAYTKRLGQQWLVRVRELAVSQRNVDRAWTLSVGRLAAWRLPGVPVLDGVQAGWRTPGFELGAYGGLVPTSLALAPDPTRVAAGAYWSLSSAREASTWRTLRHEGRVGFGTNVAGTQFVDVQATVLAAVTRSVDVSADVRAALTDGTFGLPSLRLDAVGRLTERVRINGGFRQFGADPVFTETGVTTAGPLRHADLLGEWDLSDTLHVGLDAGLASDTASDRARQYVGPIVTLPRFFGDRGGLTVGYREELGWTAGRAAWVQSQLALGGRATVFARLSYAYDGWAVASHDVGLIGSGDVRLLPWLSARGSCFVRFGAGNVLSLDSAALPLGYSFTLGLVARR